MPEPKKYQQADGIEVNTEAHGDPIEELDIRPEDIDQVKGGARRLGDPCDGGEIAKKLG
jgi:hypothetical protein